MRVVIRKDATGYLAVLYDLNVMPARIILRMRLDDTTGAAIPAGDEAGDNVFYDPESDLLLFGSMGHLIREENLIEDV